MQFSCYFCTPLALGISYLTYIPLEVQELLARLFVEVLKLSRLWEP
jgi:hypothetical protein